MVVAGHSGQLAEMAGFRLPIEAVALQALVSEPIKPCMDVVVMANTVHGYMSQSDKGEMVIGGGTDGFNNYTQRGSLPPYRGNPPRPGRNLPDDLAPQDAAPMGRHRRHDRRPLAPHLQDPLGNCFINCGWGTGGFKAIPGSGWAMAELMAKGEPGPLAEDFNMWRFKEGQFIDESVAAGVAH